MSDGINMRFGKGSFGTVSELASGEPADPVELAFKLRDRRSFGTVGELAELAVISCTRVKDTVWILKTKNGTPHTQS